MQVEAGPFLGRAEELRITLQDADSLHVEDFLLLCNNYLVYRLNTAKLEKFIDKARGFGFDISRIFSRLPLGPPH